MGPMLRASLLCYCLARSACVRVVVVGGGAAGFFGATRAASAGAPDAAEVLLLEQAPNTLTKVKVSGGGRCNVCHDETKDRSALAANYPRGERLMKNALAQFGATDAASWFRERGVPLKTEPDGRMFPVSDSSASVTEALRAAAAKAGVTLRKLAQVSQIRAKQGDAPHISSH